MVNKVVFVSSTYEDLAEHRRAVWQGLEAFDVAVRGMEDFGARTEAPLETCLAAVEQSDVYVGIIAMRLGSVEADSGKSFTQLEYERANQLRKEILIYVIDEQEALVKVADIDYDVSSVEKLKAFKQVLRERHTVDTFTTPEDLVEKLNRDFKRYFEPRKTPSGEPAPELTEAESAVRQFLLLPKRVSGREIRLRVSFQDQPYAAARILCERFRLDYGATIGLHVKITSPNVAEAAKLTELYASGRAVDPLLAMWDANKTTVPADLYARLQFSEDDVKRTQAVFFGYSYEDWEPQDNEVYVAPEGKMILLFTKAAPP